MSNGLDQIRKSITKRRKSRKNIIQQKDPNQSLRFLPSEEEKHGYSPTFTPQPSEKTKNHNPFQGQFNRYLIRAIISLFIFIAAHLIFETNNVVFEKPKEIATNVLTEDLPFARVYLWYEDTFGSPLAFTSRSSDYELTTLRKSDQALPVTGTIKEPFEQNGTGIYISPDESAAVTAWRDGVVIFAGNDRETNKTVIIQHEDKSKSVYGFLSTTNVHLYQFVPANQQIGSFEATEENDSIYFSLQKENNYMDPFQVIQVDDIP